MTHDTAEPLAGVWEVDADARTTLDDCGPQQTCRNMRHVSFDAMAEPGTDLQTAWRERLASEGKLADDAVTLRELVLGPDA